MALNIRRGLLRLWVVFTVLWLAGVAVEGHVQNQLDPNGVKSAKSHPTSRLSS